MTDDSLLGGEVFAVDERRGSGVSEDEDDVVGSVIRASFGRSISGETCAKNDRSRTACASFLHSSVAMLFMFKF